MNTDNENDDLRRPPPPGPYVPTGRRLSVPINAVHATLALLQRAGRRESGVMWYGTRDNLSNGTVSYVVAPRQRMSWGNYHINPQDLAKVVHSLPSDWKPLAQIHSHPGTEVEHSRYDDQMIGTKKVLSLVFPSYGHMPLDRFPVEVGVHEWQDGYWHLLTAAHAENRVSRIAGEIKTEDFR